MGNKYQILLLLLCCPVIVSAGQIGIIQYSSDTLMAWNQGIISNTTYFNTTTGLIQHGNTIERMKDVRYIFGYARKTGTTYTYDGLDSLNGTISYNSDNNSYYYAQIQKTKGQFTFLKNSTQNLNDNYVNMTYSLKSTNAILGNSYFVTGLTQIDILNDGQKEKFYILVNDNESVEWDNRTGTKTWNNVTRFIIDGGLNSYSFDIVFPKGVITLYNHSGSSTNGDFYFLDYIGTISANTQYNFTYYWIDAACTISCTAGASISISDGAEFTSIFQDQTKSRTCRYVITRFLPTQNCTMSADCALEPRHNVSSNYNQITDSDNYPLRCGNQTACTKNVHLLPSNKDYTFNFSGYNTGIETTRCGISDSTYVGSTLDVTTLKTWRNITLWTPPNNTMINQTKNWSVFGCNYTGPTPDSMQLLFNGSVNYTQNGGLSNISRNVSWTDCGIWLWTCTYCRFGKCEYALNGNWSFGMNSSIICPYTPGSPVVSFPDTFVIFKEEGPQETEQDFTILYILAAGILTTGIIIWVLFRENRNKNKEEAEKYIR